MVCCQKFKNRTQEVVRVDENYLAKLKISTNFMQFLLFIRENMIQWPLLLLFLIFVVFLRASCTLGNTIMREVWGCLGLNE